MAAICSARKHLQNLDTKFACNCIPVLILVHFLRCQLDHAGAVQLGHRSVIDFGDVTTQKWIDDGAW